MFRRKSRSVHNTAYTGVNHTAPPSSQPNNNALAAALTIGQTLKNGDPNQFHGSSRSNSIQRSSSIQRSTSIQNIRVVQNQKSNSLLKRSPSMGPGAKTSKLRADSNQFRNFSSSSQSDSRSINLRTTYDIDDSISESYLDEITEETTKHYNNHETVRDLKLSHTNGSPNLLAPKRHSFANPRLTPAVKMVKKYIPTPNGIKIIEVPEENLKREISRNNSIRSGANIPRSGSLTSVSGVTRTARRQPSSRLSSIIRSPQLAPMAENEPSRSFIPEKSPEQLEYELLEKKIAEEKEMQRKLELKRKEYEDLKKKRNTYQSNPVDDSFSDIKSESTVVHDSSVMNGLGINSTHLDDINDNDLNPKNIEKPILNDLSTLETVDNDNDNFISPSTSKEDEDSDFDVGINAHGVVVDEFEEKEINDSIPDMSINPSKIVVDEADGKMLKTNHQDVDDTNTTTSTVTGITRDAEEDEFGIEEGEFDADDTPVLPKGPTFDTVPSIINDGILDSDDQYLKAPQTINGGSSASSITSEESPTRAAKKPMKSAMKNSTSFYNSPQNVAKNNAAHDVYLSLATAENTRLNSKLSSTQLDEVPNPIYSANHHYPTNAGSTTPVSKRMSTNTLRKPSQQTSNSPGLVKSLRPQSMQYDSKPQKDAGYTSMQAGQKERLSNRSLRDRSSVYVQPIAPHPALQPNYQSLSKARASELYAKANSRPHSTFNLERKSSFSNEHVVNEPRMRFSMREAIQPSPAGPQPVGQQQQHQQHQQQQHQHHQHHQQQTQAPQQQYRQHQQPAPRAQPQTQPARSSRVPVPTTPTKAQPTSRLADSEDEIMSPDSGVFSSRLIDSDDESSKPFDSDLLPYSHPQSQYRQFRDSKQILTLRDPTPKVSTQKQEKTKEKKKFSGRLKKIFGRS